MLSRISRRTSLDFASIRASPERSTWTLRTAVARGSPTGVRKANRCCSRYFTDYPESQGIDVPDHRKAVIAELESLDILDATLAQELRDAIGFRDVLAHSYGPIVNDDLLYDALQNSLERYVSFVEAVSEYLGVAD